MAKVTVPVYGLRHAEKIVPCSGCGSTVSRWKAFEQAATPWNVGPNGVKSEAEIMVECKEWLEAWRGDPELCLICDPDRQKREKDPVEYQLQVWLNHDANQPALSLAVVVPVSELTSAVKQAGAEAVRAGVANWGSWDLRVQVTDPAWATTQWWKLTPAYLREDFNARRIVP